MKQKIYLSFLYLIACVLALFYIILLQGGRNFGYSFSSFNSLLGANCLIGFESGSNKTLNSGAITSAESEPKQNQPTPVVSKALYNHAFEDGIDKDGLNLTFNFNDKETSSTLMVRDEAKKYICEKNKLSFPKLSNFLDETRRRLIMPWFSLAFCFVNFNEEVDKVYNLVNVDPQNAKLQVIKNTGNTFIKSAKNGVQIDKNSIIFNVFYNLINLSDKVNLETQPVLPSVFENDVENHSFVRGVFETNYSSSSADRKHNIKTALSNFDGLQLMPGESLSFNNTTGERTAENGYKGAKVIIEGQYEDGIGGGVCQASTTLYNACLIAGLKIEEVNQHSLKVGYVDPSFDAMVNYGSSDLVVKNSTDDIITFATVCDDKTCKVIVFGQKNPYVIKRKSEVINTIDPPADKLVQAQDIGASATNDYYLTYPKAGTVSVGYLEYFNGDCLVSTKKIRQNTYKPTQGVKVVV